MDTNIKQDKTEKQYRQYQTRLLPYAYNILGDTLEAEDVVQEILNFYFLNSTDHVQHPVSYLTRSVINRSINAKKKIQVRKEHYNGQWLPVPLYTEDTIYRDIDKRHILDYSLLFLLERLNPKERAVFILKETFDFQHAEIAEVLGSTEDNSRQLFKRARKKLELEEEHVFTRDSKPDKTLQQLTEAILQSDITRVKSLLNDNIQSFSDGGKVRAARNVIRGRVNVGKFLQVMYDKYFLKDSEVVSTRFNHCPALVFKLNGIVYRCMVFEIRDNIIENVYIIVNPDKLRSLQSIKLSR